MAPHFVRVRHSADNNKDHHGHDSDSTCSDGSHANTSKALLCRHAEPTGIFDPVGHSNIPISDSLMLDPISKLRRYKIFPFKLVVHSCILMLLLIYTYAYNTNVLQRQRDERFGIARTFSSNYPSDDGVALEQGFGHIDEVTGFIQTFSKRYYTIPEDSPGVFMHYVTDLDSLSPIPPVMTVRLLRDPASQYRSSPLAPGVMTEVRTYNLTSDNQYLGAFADPTLGAYSTDCVPKPGDEAYISCRNDTFAALFDRIVEGDVTFELRSVRFFATDTKSSVVHWNVRLHFFPDSHGSIMHINSHFNPVHTDAPSVLAMTVTTLLVPFVMWHLWLRLRAFQRYHIYMTVFLPEWLSRESTRKYRERHAGTSWKSFAIAVDLLCCAFIIMSYVDQFMAQSGSDLGVWRSIVLGFTVAGYNLLYISYLQTSPQFYVLIKTMSLAIPKLLVYCIGVVPIFAAFTLCGVVVVGPYAQDTFGDIHLAACTLFCVLNGDSLLQLFTEINQTPFPPLRMFTRFYFMSFLAYTIICALNVMLGIVQDSYTEVSDYFQICQFDVDMANEELAMKDLSAAERREKKLEKEQRKTAGGKKFSQYETGSTTQDDNSTRSDSDSDKDLPTDPRQLRAMARQIEKVGVRARNTVASATPLAAS